LIGFTIVASLRGLSGFIVQSNADNSLQTWKLFGVARLIFVEKIPIGNFRDEEAVSVFSLQLI
jgi:hypothetical protein